MHNIDCAILRNIASVKVGIVQTGSCVVGEGDNRMAFKVSE